MARGAGPDRDPAPATAPASAPASALEAPYDRVGRLPRALQRPGLVTSAGRTGPRLADLAHWLTALTGGRLPAAARDFGDPQAMCVLHAALREAGLATACQGQAALAETALQALLWHLDRIADLQPRLTRAQAIAQVAAEWRAEWDRQRGDWDEALALLQDLGELGALQWDRLRGRLRTREWREARRVQAHLARQPALVALIRRLGRAERPSGAPAAAPPPRETAPRHGGVTLVETRLPGLPGALRGIRLSGRLEGMLGSEAVMLRHPVLKKLWRARQAESRLLVYDSEAVLRDWRPDPLAPPATGAAPPRPDPRERGPILLCLDTSGSMRGAPETLAKAVALEVLRSAHRERRRCLLIAFGGADEVLEHELAPTPEGLEALLGLMGRSFDGGTDLQAPVAHAIGRVRQAGWDRADLLIVSDGEFGCVPATLDELDATRAGLGLRVQGVLVGDRETLGLLEVCDDIFWVRDWRAHAEDAAGAGGGFSPVHSQSLTAMYFPNALSPRAARRRPPAA